MFLGISRNVLSQPRNTRRHFLSFFFFFFFCFLDGKRRSSAEKRKIESTNSNCSFSLVIFSINHLFSGYFSIHNFLLVIVLTFYDLLLCVDFLASPTERFLYSLLFFNVFFFCCCLFVQDDFIMIVIIFVSAIGASSPPPPPKGERR